MSITIPQARQMTAMAGSRLTATREAQLSQTLMSRPTGAKPDGGEGALLLLVEQQKQSERIEKEKQQLSANTRLNDLVAKEGNAEDLQTIIAIEHQKEALDGGDDEVVEIMQSVAEQPLISGYTPQESQARDTEASRMAEEIKDMLPDRLVPKGETKEKMQRIGDWCSKHIALLSILAMGLLIAIWYYWHKLSDR